MGDENFPWQKENILSTRRDRLTKLCLRMFKYHQQRQRRRLVYHLAKLRESRAGEKILLKIVESIHASKMLSSKTRLRDVENFYSIVKCQHYAASFVITSLVVV
jgi:hypothetical protein